ncbi:MAG: hypothetical protein WDO06_04570 [Actinomycetota bacterium]
MVHGVETCDRVEMASRALFGQAELSEIDEATMESALAELPRVLINKNEPIPTWVDLLTSTGVAKSKSDARRVIKDGGAYLNNHKVSEESFSPA